MMMALRQSPTEQLLFQALDGSKPPRRLSRGAAIAIAGSIAAHLALIAYLMTQHFTFQAPTTEEAHTITMSTVVLTPPKAPPTPTPARDHSISQTRAVTTPVTPAQPLHPVVTSQTGVQGIELTTGAPGQDFTLSPPEQPPARIIVDPTWLSEPSAAELTRFYPQRAIDLGLSGSVNLVCGVVASGRLGDCRVAAETPAQARFGDAALKLAPYFKMSPRTVDGQAVDGGTVKFSIVFKLADGG